MRLMAKTVSYGLVHVMVAATLAFALTGDWKIAVGIGLLEPLVQMAVYPLHEWLWEKRAYRVNDVFRRRSREGYVSAGRMG